MNQYISDSERNQLLRAFGVLITACYQGSASKGFWKDYEDVRNLIQDNATRRGPEATQHLLRAVEKMMFGQKMALIHSEGSEALEGNRKDKPSDKIEGFSSEEEEMADMVIRICDLSGRLGYRLAEAILAKIDMNAGRPYMHGKAY